MDAELLVGLPNKTIAPAVKQAQRLKWSSLAVIYAKGTIMAPQNAQNILMIV